MAADKLGDASSTIADCVGTVADPAVIGKLSSEEYLAKFKLQENLEDLINKVLKEKPQDPYGAMADFLSSVNV